MTPVEMLFHMFLLLHSAFLFEINHFFGAGGGVDQCLCIFVHIKVCSVLFRCVE